MFLFDWIAQWREMKYCESCEILKHELEIERLEKNKLLERILNPPKPEPDVIIKHIDEPKPILPNHFQSFKVKRQLLEAEDRHRAKTLKEKQNEIDAINKVIPANKEMTVEDIEKVLGVDENAS